ncbi:hypothetical protein [Actinosynnema sp. NPDC020468]|uniref:hypothetical protein n=1 Tax=Actinosynnema sp. NPDC020468 TaxID=3154488 RepID=UPI0033E8EC23
MRKWQRIVVTLLLLVEVAITLLPVLRDVPPIDRPTVRIRHGVRLAVCTMLLITAGSVLASVWLRPNTRIWLVPFAGTHLAAAGLGWAHALPVVTLVAVTSVVLVPVLVLLPTGRSQ